MSSFSEGKLPPSFLNEVETISSSLIILRSNVKSIQDCDKWVKDFGELTNTRWNFRSSKPSGQRFTCSKKFVCHHSAFQKVPAEANKRTISKNLSCKATINIKVKLDTKSTKRKDLFLQKGLPAVITINDDHNHSLNTAEVLKFLPSAGCKDKFIEYFNDGMGTTEACRYHEKILQQEGKFTEKDMANRRINPSHRAVQYWYDQWRLQNSRPRTTRGSSKMSEEDQLCEVDWIAIPDEPYIMKYVFSDTVYNIMVSNLTFLYMERLTDIKIQERFCKLNPYAQMKSQIILENLKKSLEKCLSEKSALSMKFQENKLFITLKFPVAHVLCSYDIEMDLMTADKVMQYIISPTIFGALLSQRKVLELKKRKLPENIKSFVSSSISVSPQNVIEPEWLKGQNVCFETVLDSYLEIQDHFKDLFAENNKDHSLLKKVAEKKVESTQCGPSQKKCKLQKNVSDESASIALDDEQRFYLDITIKEEKEDSTSDTDWDTFSQPSKNNVKKKKTFKI